MKAIVVFHDRIESRHPLAFLLRRGFWHCFCCVLSNGLWIQIDGEEGVPVVRYLCEDDEFDLVAHYRDQGCTVVETVQRAECLPSPLALRNCVGLVKATLCIRSWAITPYGLYKHLVNR